MDDLEKFLNKQLENEEFKKEWEEFQPELQLMKQIIGEKCFLMSVTEEKTSSDEAVKIILNK